MEELQEFHQKQTSSNKEAKLIVGAVIIALLAGLGTYTYKLGVSSQSHSLVPDDHLPSP